MSFDRLRKVLINFLSEVIVGSLIFLVIAAAAVSLDFLLHALREKSVDPVVMVALYAGKYVLLVVDFALFIRFMFIQMMSTWRGLAS